MDHPHHDPRQIIETLRDHLATHAKPISFLFGAGTSSAINVAPEPTDGKPRGFLPLIPAIDGLTKSCGDAVKKLGKKHSAAWDALRRECDDSNQGANIENILTRIRTKIAAMGPKDALIGLDFNQMEATEREIRREIVRCVTPMEDTIPTDSPHANFARWVRQATRKQALEIFTPNYDILIERALEHARVPVFDGFVGGWRPYFHAECLESEETLPGSQFVRLWKIHGSVNWQESTIDAGVPRIYRVSGGIDEEGSMVFPSHRKYDESRKQPYRALLDRLSTVLQRDGALLVCCGYSFGDEHINAIILTVLNRRPLSHAIVLRYSDLSATDPLVILGSQYPNLVIVAPNAGVVGGHWGTWRLTEAIDEAKREFFSPALVITEPKGDSQEPTAQLRLGDFNAFCSFLSKMAYGVWA